MDTKLGHVDGNKVTKGIRDATFDLAKFIAIYMVILWHCYPVGWHADKWTSAIPANLIVGCNMPLFFLISGYFARKMFARGEWKELIIRQCRYFWPVFVFSFLDVVVCIFVHGESCAFLSKWMHLLMFSFWFFCCLSLCEVTTFCCFKVGRGHEWGVKILACLVFLSFWTIPFGMWCFVEMVPFYWLGVFWLPRVYENQRMQNLGVLMVLAYIVISIIEGDITKNGMGFYWDRMRLLNFSFDGLWRMFARYFMGFLGSVGVLMTTKMIVGKCKKITLIAAFGTTTFGVYFSHRYLVDEWKRIGDLDSTSFACTLGLAAVILYVCHGFVLWTRRSRIAKCILWEPWSITKK